MAVYDKINGTYSQNMAPEIKEYFDKALTHDPEENLVHHRDMDKKVLPKKSGKSMNMRRMHAFAPAPIPLKEGVTPDGLTPKMSEIYMSVKPYGRHIEFTDELDMYAIDNTTQEFAKILSRQATETLDAICAYAKHSGKNVLYAKASGGANTSRASITEDDVLTSALVKRAVRILERNKAKRFPDGCYHAIVDADTKYDLTNDPMWIDIAKYQDKENYEKYEIGKMHGVKFYETTMNTTVSGDKYLYDTVTELAINGGKYDVEAQKGYFTVAPTVAASSGKDVDIDYWCRRMADKVVLINGVRTLIDKCEYDGTVIKCNIRYMDTDANWMFASGNKIAAEGVNETVEVHLTPVYGEGFCGTVTLGSEGGTIKSIINPPGSSGSDDPLAQRGTVAWKIDGFGATVLEDAYGVRIEHAVSE